MNFETNDEFYKHAGSNAQKAIEYLKIRGFSGRSIGIEYHPEFKSPDKIENSINFLYERFSNFVQPENDFFVMSYFLGNKFSDKTWLFYPDFKAYMLKSSGEDNPWNLVDTAKKLTDITNKEVLIIYENNYFSLPKLIRVHKQYGKIRTIQTPRIKGMQCPIEWDYNHASISPIREFRKIS